MSEKLKKQYRELRWLLGDQLNQDHSWFDSADSDVLYVIAELPQETGYVTHHVQKVCAFFAAMESFADWLRERDHHALHLTLDDTADSEDLPDLISSLCSKYQVSHFRYQRPDEHRLLMQLRELKLPKKIDIHEADTEHFLLPFEEIEKQFPKGKSLRMETFYRRMRKKHDILMNGDQPAGERWNFDAENRKRLKQEEIDAVPTPKTFRNDVSKILQRLDKHGIKTFGEAKDTLAWPTDRQQSLTLLRFFCGECLPNFGRYQDAMTGRSQHAWSLYHSRISFALNSKIISPREVIDRAVSAYQENEAIDLAQVEGFVRQILGWREFIRGIYWANMPDYETGNHFQARRKLPDFFWTGDTGMRCLQQSIGQSLEHAYAHHIQRLMITGNFALLAGINPNEVDDWYLGVYIDAIQWVELPNTRGMALFADGGLVGSKPYAAGGNYIKKMSDYCSDCRYKVAEKSGDTACPFNSWYWRFMDKHRDELAKNQRLGMLYGSWDRMDKDQREAILDTAERNLRRLEKL